ncbi:MAG: hypothetical protein D6675_01940 [Gemmatimonadetes bacterium]|nr:MAG: hypothetical protein D6675_01940 [Gemmatimonadota bacterium]
MRWFWIFAILTFPLSGQAFTLLGAANYGDLAQGHNAKSLALGATSVAVETGAAALFTNPAALTRVNRAYSEASFGIIYSREIVSQKVFDSFESTIGDAAIATNKTVNGFPYLGGFVIPLDLFGLSKNYVVSLGYTSLYDFHYEHEQENRDSEYQITNTLAYSSEGSLNSFSLGFAAHPFPVLSMGASVHILTGEHTIHFEYDDRSTSDETDEVWGMDYENLSGYNLSLGVLVQPLAVRDRFTVGAYLQTPAEISGDQSMSVDVLSTDRQVTYPLRAGLGIDYMPRNPLVSRLVADFIYNNYSQMEDDNNPDLDLEDTVEFHVGLEHVLAENVPVRIGFYWEPTATDNDLASTFLTFGSGYQVDYFMLDIGVKLGKRNYRDGDVSYNANNQAVFDRIQIEDVKIEETYGQLIATLKYGF